MMCQKMFSALLSAVLLASRALATNSRYQAIPEQAKTFINVIKMEINLNRKVGVRNVLQNAFPPRSFWSLHSSSLTFRSFGSDYLFVHSISYLANWTVWWAGVCGLFRRRNVDREFGRKSAKTNELLAFCSVTYPSAYFHYLRHESAATQIRFSLEFRFTSREFVFCPVNWQLLHLFRLIVAGEFALKICNRNDARHWVEHETTERGFRCFDEWWLFGEVWIIFFGLAMGNSQKIVDYNLLF